MPKQFIAAFGGKAKVFSSKLGYLKWALSTRDGFKHLMLLPLIALVWLRSRKDLENLRKERLSQSADGEQGGQ